MAISGIPKVLILCFQSDPCHPLSRWWYRPWDRGVRQRGFSVILISLPLFILPFMMDYFFLIGVFPLVKLKLNYIYLWACYDFGFVTTNLTFNWITIFFEFAIPWLYPLFYVEFSVSVSVVGSICIFMIKYFSVFCNFKERINRRIW